MSVLILTMPGDLHAHAVRWAIQKLGGEANLLYPLDLANGARWSFDPDEDALWIDSAGRHQTVRRSDFSTLWLRRPPITIPAEKIEDTHERAVAEEELRIFAGGVLRWLEAGKFTVNPGGASGAASQKPFQMAVAAGVGLTGPRTLISNSPEQILDFFDACGGEFIFKPLKAAVWKRPNGDKAIVPTTLINDKSTLTDADLSLAPGIYQEKIVKQAEIRATFMGKSVFAWEKRFDGRPHEELAVDWRIMNRDSKHKIHILPDDIIAKCHDLMSALGLVYGAFDFAIDAQGQYQFLEVNPQGQFLWGDQVCEGMNQLEAFAEFLLTRDANFRYSNSNRCDFKQYYDEGIFENDAMQESRLHYENVNTFNYKLVSVAF